MFLLNVKKKARILWHKYVFYSWVKYLSYKKHNKVNLGSGPVRLPQYWNIDLSQNSDLILDLEKSLLPFPCESMDVAICISAINYFSRARGQELISEVYRILRKGGVARFAAQDLRRIAKSYVEGDKKFFFQKLPNGKERFHGITMADKLNSWFYGYETAGGKKVKYFYDFESLAVLFQNAGFRAIERKAYLESRIEDIDKIDNRPKQMFFLEAVK